ncbi:type II CRISPR RNA-guided endonuclease Cas9 [Myroides marinus]|uniref:type II CRISPR RNA-guided endonuclease Cas9 n=1 Tax=Myroides marinus TaxID=703342 RepID=UPI002579062B|nr:type II CRISPR RNA-guided endonuclease Cas9 [Myroides marinus]MDM1346863.1 type II CRISPR RNA-guided endonuclease Cas9 [Myroides marinus]MDM1370805.1 type II CRISPR RNA-guided endonuclease Cas9 [Myroides marinus]MDM1531874.1 type II CRISPR RNA-guided endonuclease Cas9 [Myroides marinus]MDM1538702.1 type II CRISPR RNA-guided endonuclease Cas9 [Myroides marinus]
MKKILGLDLGTTSIGWAYVHEAENDNEVSSIQKIGVRVNPLTVDEQINFEKGKPITTNATRTESRSARRNLQRYKLRREHLINILTNNNWIAKSTILTETGNQSTFETYLLRNKAVSEQITLAELSRILLMINKKRGYKSSRKVNNTEEGQLIDGMAIAKRLYNEQLTPGQLSLELIQKGIKKLPDYYRSDLNQELDLIWSLQQKYYPEIFTESFKDIIKGKGLRATSALFWTTYNFNTADNKGTRDEKKLQSYKWRVEALSKQLTKEEVAFVIAEINGQIHNSSGYLGAISDRSKELYFNKWTVGQYLYKQLQEDPHTRLKSQVFYRQDYLDEFETIWNTQSKYYPTQLTSVLKEEIRDTIIFYQRKLKSQKGLISFCEFEQEQKTINGKVKTVGNRVIPKSSPLFQEFKIWQQLHNVTLRNKDTNEIISLAEEQKIHLFEELNLKGRLSSAQVLKLIEDKPKKWELNYTELEGNNTNKVLYNAYLDIIDDAGYDVRNELKVKLNKDDIELTDLDVDASQIKEMIYTIFNDLGIDTSILEFNALLENQAFEKQASYQLWHLLYSYEEDNSPTGLEKLYELLQNKFSFTLEQAKRLGNILFQDDYGNLSTKAIRKIFPFITDNKYSDACDLAGYKHSKHSITKEENENRELKNKLDILAKNSLRNPVVEKILNQMINVINTLIDSENSKLIAEGKSPNFQFDEIRIELARELKKNAKEREELTRSVTQGKTDHEKIIKILQKEDGIKNPTRNDIIRYKLYQELKNTGYKDLYTNEYIERKDIFTKEYDIEHIIPQSKLFDDSFSNKTLVRRNINLKKGNQTAYDFILTEYGYEKAAEFEQRVTDLFNLGISEGISKSKFKKLLMKESEIGQGFIERDLRDTQYIAKKAKAMLFEITRQVVSTSGNVTDRLRDDWGLINVMKELNIQKYRDAGLTEFIEMKDGNKKEVIIDWTKRNDHRHHAMDALTVAFTKHNHIQYLNNLNARKNSLEKAHSNIIAIETKETHIIKDEIGNRKRVFKEPIPNFRQVAKQHLESILVSHKAKNKVVTKNTNKISGQKVGQQTLTPRGQLHKETVYGKIHQYASKEEKVGPKFTVETIQLVSNPTYRKLLLKRLEENNNDPKKAFGSKNALGKSPIYIDLKKNITVPETVKLVWLEEDYTIRKEITPDLKIDKVIDQGVKRILESRLQQYDNNPKLAFSDLDKNPIWLNEDKGIAIKRVTISGVKNAEALHIKKNHLGQPILDNKGFEIPVDFINTGNNHHVAIYEDENGKIQDTVIPLFEVVERVNQQIPIIDKTFNQHLGWKFLFTMKQNELFLFPTDDFNPKEVDLFDRKNYTIISKHLFRVQKFSKVEYGNSAVRDYVFRHHLETNVTDVKELRDKSHIILKSTSALENIIKIRTNHLGEIIHIGEY